MTTLEKIEISHKTIVFTVLFLLSLWFVYFIRDLIAQFFVALLIMAIFNPMVTRLSKYKVPRVLSVLIVYLLALGIVIFTVASLAPIVIDQTTSFINGLPLYLENIGVFGSYSEAVVGQLIAQIGTLPSQLAKVTVSVFSNAFSVLTILIFAFYLLVSRENFDHRSDFFFGKKRSKEIADVLDLLEKRLGGWARGQLALMLLVWISTYIGLLLLGIPYALPLSILAGILEMIPYIGPIVAAIPTVIIGFGISPVIGLATTALAFLVQQLENYIFVPKILEKTAGLHPIVILMALAVGFRLGGIAGILISIPVAITVQVLSNRYFFTK